MLVLYAGQSVNQLLVLFLRSQHQSPAGNNGVFKMNNFYNSKKETKKKKEKENEYFEERIIKRTIYKGKRVLGKQ